MNYKRKTCAMLLPAITLLIAGCNSIDLTPPMNVGNGDQLEGRVSSAPAHNDGWQSYDYYPPAPRPDPVAPVSGRVPAAPPIETSTLPAPDASSEPSSTGMKYAAPSSDALANKFSANEKKSNDRASSWGVDPSGDRHSYSSRPSVDSADSIWIEQNVLPEDRTDFAHFLDESRRLGNARFVSISGNGYEASRLGDGKVACSQLKVSKFSKSNDTPSRPVVLTRCGR